MAVGIGRNGSSVSSFWLFTLLQKCRLIVCLSVRPQDKLATCPGCYWGSWDRVRVQQKQVWKINGKACRSENQACAVLQSSRFKERCKKNSWDLQSVVTWTTLSKTCSRHWNTLYAVTPPLFVLKVLNNCLHKCSIRSTVCHSRSSVVFWHGNQTKTHHSLLIALMSKYMHIYIWYVWSSLFQVSCSNQRYCEGASVSVSCIISNCFAEARCLETSKNKFMGDSMNSIAFQITKS